MSTIDEKYQKVVGSPVDEIIGSEKGSSAIILVFFMAGLIASLVVGWVIFPKILYSQKKQPFDFSHEVHNEQVEECTGCHKFRSDGTFAGVPKLEQCVECHEEVQGETPNEKVFVEEYVAKEKEVPWLVYSKQPDCVFFSHAAHVKKAEMECKECHGDIGQSKNLKVYEENRLTGVSRDIWGKSIGGFRSNTWDSMKMDVCAKCHEEKTGSKGACFQCHK